MDKSLLFVLFWSVSTVFCAVVTIYHFIMAQRKTEEQQKKHIKKAANSLIFLILFVIIGVVLAIYYGIQYFKWN